MPNYVQVGTPQPELRTFTLKRGDSNTLTAKWSGEYEECRAFLPERGEYYDEASTDELIASMRCTESQIVKGDGGTAEVTAIYESNVDEEGVTTEPIGVAVFEVEFGELRKPIEQHPRCGELADTLKTWQDWATLEESDYVAAKWDTGEFTISGESIWTLEEYQDLKLRGVDEYVTFVPKVRRTLRYVAKPDGVGAYCGTQQNPPDGSFNGMVVGEGGITSSDTADGGWDWLAGVDRCLKSGNKYERTTEWLGASRVEDLIYVDWS